MENEKLICSPKPEGFNPVNEESLNKDDMIIFLGAVRNYLETYIPGPIEWSIEKQEHFIDFAGRDIDMSEYNFYLFDYIIVNGEQVKKIDFLDSELYIIYNTIQYLDAFMAGSNVSYLASMISITLEKDGELKLKLENNQESD